MGKKEGPQRIGDVLSQVLARRGIAQVEAQEELHAAWRLVAGPQLSATSQPGPLRGGVLEIVAMSSTVVQELAFRADELQEQLSRQLPRTQLRGLKFRVGRLA